MSAKAPRGAVESEMPTMPSSEQVDSPLIWPSLAAIAAPLVLVAVWAAPFGVTFAAVPILFFVWAIAALVATAMAFAMILRRSWWRAGSLLVLPVLAILAVVDSKAFWLCAIDTGERLHFDLMRSAYVARIAKLPPNQGPRLAIFDWGGFGVSHAVVYDESDEIMKPGPERSVEWQKRIADTELACGVEADPQGDHFYIVRIGC